MKLIDLVENIENADPDAIIFQEDMTNPSSDIILSFVGGEDQEIKEERGRKYHYLIEVFLAKEFIEDWNASLGYEPSAEETAKRLYEYAINDA
ncbi:hypothetical protein SAMN05216327_12355 [Dyadobacter sp. SG02]|uniref:hypothetical protein n=1 Tax=Dyadobacter sp. SG02 TaxID=1855291 RepID=UPI0008D884BB|nr:hypothetical protein [Dyadobacter sp. SG02]SEJ84050.1 hypothetical protein SAMN05216327_12355 [Dyadobacter sp. SG02]